LVHLTLFNVVRSPYQILIYEIENTEIADGFSEDTDVCYEVCVLLLLGSRSGDRINRRLQRLREREGAEAASLRFIQEQDWCQPVGGLNQIWNFVLHFRKGEP
jgi:hypothetical protein